MIHKIKNEIIENKKFIYFSYLISILTMIPQLSIAPPLNDSKHVVFLFLVLIVLFFISKFSKILFLIFTIYINLSNIIIGHIFIHWGYANADIRPRIDVAAISPKYESYEYLMTYIDYRDGLLAIYTFFVLLMLYKFIVHYKHSFKFLRLLGFISAIAIIMTVSFYLNPLTSQEPFSIPDKCIESVQYDKFLDRKKYLNSLKVVSTHKKNLPYDKIIFIQGEAVNKHHMAIYGYDKNTTPFFLKLKAKKELYIFNAIAPINQTRHAVPILHTKATVHDFKEVFTHSQALVGKLKSYGYKTYWISNQGEVGKYDTSVASMAHEASIEHFWNLNFSTAKPDKMLLTYLNSLKDNSNKEMYVFHLMGSHVKYTRRYTKDISLFKNPSNINEEYDNTIYYTDYIIENIFKKFKDKKVLIIYASDHGEVVGKKNGHGFNPPYKDEYDVPFVIYSSVYNAKIDQLYKDNNKGYFNLENLNYIIEYLSGISDDANISYSSDVSASAPKNIFDYNKLEFCED